MQKIILTLLVIAGILSIALPVNNYAAEFIKADDTTGNILLTDPAIRHENVYAGGNNITIKTQIFKDLYLGGSNITIEGQIERSLFAGASNITIKNTTIGGGVKIGGSNVTLDNVKIEDDVFIGGTNITITNSSINGDLLVGTSNITMTGSTVAKNMHYGGPKNDSLKAQVKGEFKEDTSSAMKDKMMKNNKDNKKGFFTYFNAVTIFSSLVILLTEIFILNKYKKIRDRRIGFNGEGKSLQHLGSGALFLILIPLLIIGGLASFGLLAPLTLNLAAIITLLFFLLSPLVSYYLANLVFGDSILWWHPIIIFIILTFLSLIPYVGNFINLVVFILTIMTFGYYFQKAFSGFRRELES
jgi:carbonic anhydrase/acetyltransferase-like protein (isoleucine patch superfamily)